MSYLPDTLGIADLPARNTGLAVLGTSVGGGLALGRRGERVGEGESREGGEDDGLEVHLGGGY